MSSLTWLIDLGESSIVVQTAQALITAAVFVLFQRRYASPALTPWTLAWLALCAQLVAVGALRSLEPALPPTARLAAVLTGVMLLAGYLKLGWLLLGAYAIARGSPAPAVLTRGTVGLGIALAALTTLPGAFAPDGQITRFVARAGGLALLCGGGSLAAGLALVVRRRRTRPGASAPNAADRPELGRLLVGFSLLAVGTHTLGSFAVTLAGALAAPRLGSPAEYVPIVPGASGLHLLLNVELSLGLVIWLLEVEQQRAEHRAYHDPLTGLPNRQLLLDRLRHQVAASRRTQQPFAVLFVDVDHFKSVNDALGHATGDRLLQVVAGRLTGALREADTVARIGGDEFVVLATDLHRPDDVTAIGDKLRDAMHAPIAADGREFWITLSVGASIFPDDAGDADALLRVADAALYRAKAGGRDRMRLAGT